MTKAVAIAMLTAIPTVAVAMRSYGQTPVFIDLSPSHLEFSERSLCSDYLRMLPPWISRKLAFADDLVCELRSIGQRRFEQQNAHIAALRSSGVAIKDGPDRLNRFDNQLAKTQFNELRQLLTQKQLDSLMREYFRTYRFEKLLDPLAAEWLSLTNEELAATALLHDEYQTALMNASDRYSPLTPTAPARNRLPISFHGNLTPEMKKVQRELAQLEARRWSAVAGRKLERCFKQIGFISADETLADYLSRNPDKSEIYIEELPAFRIALLRAEANTRRHNSGSK